MHHNETRRPDRGPAIAVVLALLAAAGCTVRDYAEVEAVPDSVRATVRASVDQGGRPAVVVGLLNPAGEHYYAYGTAEAGRDVAVSERTTFAIGSLTKLFTAQLLARQVADGAVTLDTSLVDLWDGLEAGGGIRLWQLASHRAGLPRDIPAAALQQNDIEPLLALLAKSDGGGDEIRYSNAGMALLGATLAHQAGKPLPDLMDAKVLTPLGLTATGYTPDAVSLAHPHRRDEDISARRPPTVSVAYGAGGLHSSARDLLRFARHHLDPPSHAEALVVALMLGHAEGQSPALGWQIHEDGDMTVYHHGGDGNGYQAFIGVRPDNGVAVVLLSNASADDALQDIALHLLDPRVPLPEFDGLSAVVLDEQILQTYAGHYGIVDDPDGNTIELRVERGRLIYVERGPEGKLVRRSPLYAEDDRHLVLREIPVRLSFDEGTRESAVLEAGDMRFELRLLDQ